MNNLILIIGLSINFAFASEVSVGRITEITGAGFISYKGNTHEAKKGDLIYPNSEIVVEHKGRVTYADNFDHKFHLGNSTSVAVTKKGIELRAGDLWLQSLNRNDYYKLNTANAIVEFQNGEGIITYESGAGKTQLMVINGLMKFSNLKIPDLNLSVSEGNFSYVDNNYESGAPRDPTPVGSKTYKELLTLFQGITPMSKNNSQVVAHEENKSSHEEASVEVTSPTVHENKHETKREIASTKVDKFESKILDEYKDTLFKKEKKVVTKIKSHNYKKVENYKVLNPLIVHIYGQNVEKASNLNKSENRAPASVQTSVDDKVENNLEIKNNLNTKENKATPNKETEKLLDQIKNL